MKLSLLLLAAAVLCSSVLKADLIYTNFGTGHAYTAGVGLTPGYSAVASSFTPGARFAVGQFEFAAFRSGPDIPDSVTFALYDDAAGLPSAQLEAFTLAQRTLLFGLLPLVCYPVLVQTYVGLPT